MKLNFGREISYSKLERKSSRKNSKDKSLSKSNIRNKLNSQNKSIEKLSELNSDIEKLYKKYAEVKKQRLMKEKSQQILVNRLKVLRYQQNSSKNKESVYNLSRPSDKKEKIHVRINSKYKKSNNLIKRYKESEKKNDFNESEIKNINFRTINNRKDSNIEKYSNSIVEDKHYHNHHIGKLKGNKDNRTLNNNDKNLDSINNIEDFLQKYKYNIGNKNSNNNIYIIINNPNNYTEQQTTKKNNEEKNAIYDYDNELSNEELSKRHIKSDFNLDFERRGEKIILMNTDGRKIEDIIKSINSISSMNNNININDVDNLNSKIEISSRRSYKANDKNDIKKEYIVKENCDNNKNDDKNNENENNDDNCIKDDLNDKDNIISKEDSIDINMDSIKNKIDKNNNNDINDNNDANKNQVKIKEKEKEKENIQSIENINNNKENNNKNDENNQIIIENKTKEVINDNNNNEDNNNENLNMADNDNVKTKDNENKEKENINNINENGEKVNLEEESKINNNKKLNENDNKTQEFIRPNFLDLYKNEDNFSISRQKIDISIYQTTNQKSLTPNRKTENKLTIKDEEKENDNLNSNLPNNNTNNNHGKNSIIKNMKYHKYNNISQDPQNNQICLDLSSIVSNSTSSKKKLRKKVVSPNNNMNIGTNNSNKNSLNLNNNNNKKESDYIYLNGKKLEDMYSNSTKNTNAQTICASNNDYNKLASMINKNEENSGNKTTVSNSLFTPKKLENNKKVKVNKKFDNSFPNNQKLSLCDKIKGNKNINLKKKNNHGNNYTDLINYSLSFKGFSNKSNYNSTHNTRRNSNFEKIRKNNFRKDTYCTSIEKKRRALGLQFNPNFDKELSMQTDKNSFSKKILDKFKTYKINKRDYKTINSNDYSMDKHKLIKVNKRDEGNSANMNMERINATPQRFKIIKNNINKHMFVKNKTTTNFNYDRKSMNFDMKKCMNDLKNKNLKKGSNIFTKFILFENNNNSNSSNQINQVNDNSNLFLGTNKTINVI